MNDPIDFKRGGGPAYPVIVQSGGDGSAYGLQTGPISGWETGMTIRDVFAANERSHPPKAWLQVHFQQNDLNEFSGVVMHEALAKWRYEMADAMLRARKAEAPDA